MAAGAYVQRGKADQGGGAPARAADLPRVDDKTPSRGVVAGIKEKLAAYKTRLERYALFRVLESVAEGFSKDRVTENAAAMTYYGVFSLFPLFLLFMSVAGLVLQNNDVAREQIMGVVIGLLPQGQDKLREVIEGVIKARGSAAGIGVLTLLYSAMGWFKVIDSNINEIWGVSKKRSFIKGNLFALAMVAGIGGVAILSFGANAAVNLLKYYSDQVFQWAWLWQTVVSLVSVLTMAGVFFVLYRFAPQRKIAVGDIWPAALATAVLWELTRRVLAFYLEKNNMISAYGPIGAAMALLFWIYIASIIILLGAELSYAIAKERRHIPAEQEMEVVSPPGEQPTPKFAPQVGAGHYAGKDQDEPIKPARPAGQDLQPANGLAGSPRYAGGPVATPAWMSQPAPLDRAAQARDRESKPIHLDVPLVALVSVCIGFVLGWFGKKDAAHV